MKNYSDFWFDKYDTDIDELLGIEKEKPKKDYIQMASNQRAIANFVRIVSGQNIPVKYTQRGDSYTDGKNVTISANIKDNNFDPTVGLALHEGSHIKLSDFKLLNNLAIHTKDLVENGVNSIDLWVNKSSNEYTTFSIESDISKDIRSEISKTIIQINLISQNIINVCCIVPSSNIIVWWFNRQSLLCRKVW